MSRKWPVQDAKMVTRTVSRLTDEQVAEVRGSLARAEAGEFASDGAVKELYEKHGA